MADCVGRPWQQENVKKKKKGKIKKCLLLSVCSALQSQRGGNKNFLCCFFFFVFIPLFLRPVWRASWVVCSECLRWDFLQHLLFYLYVVVLFLFNNEIFPFLPIPTAKPGSEAPDLRICADSHRNSGGLGRLRQHRCSLPSPPHEFLQMHAPVLTGLRTISSFLIDRMLSYMWRPVNCRETIQTYMGMRWQQVPINLGCWSLLQYIAAVISWEACVLALFNLYSGERYLPAICHCHMHADLKCTYTYVIFMDVWDREVGVSLLTSL